jgi:cytidyltransferase-like protein
MRSTLRSTESTLKGENKMKALVCGSFDPITNGHVDLIKRAASMFEDVTVGIFVNSAKRYVFSEEQRLDLIRESIKDVKNAHAELCSVLQSIGAATTPRDLGIDSANIGEIFEATRDIRDKYTVSRLVFDLGLTEEIKQLLRETYR